MKSALEIVAYANVSEAEGTIALLEVAIDALNRSGFVECADKAHLVLNQYLQENIFRMTGDPCLERATTH